MSQMKDCVDKYNQLVVRATEAGVAGYKPVKKFESVTIAEARIAKLVEALKDHALADQVGTDVVVEDQRSRGDAEVGHGAFEVPRKTPRAKKLAVERTPKISGQSAAPERFKSARAGTTREAVIRSSGLTLAAIAHKIGRDRKTVLAHLFCLNRDCGVGYRVEGDVVTLIFPKGKTVDDAVRAKAEK